VFWLGKSKSSAKNLLSPNAMSRSPQSPDLAVVMPIYNEAASIRAVVQEWFRALDQTSANFILFAINDGSTDETVEVLSALRRELGPRLSIVNKENSGHGRSCRLGYEIALAEGAPWILQIDSDGQCDPAFLPWPTDGANFDCAFGYRRTRDDGIGRRLVSQCCRMVLWLVTGTYVRDPNVPYRLIRAGALRNALSSIPADFNLQNIALSLVLKRNEELRWRYFPIHFRARRGGESTISYCNLLKTARELLRDLRRINDREFSVSWRSSPSHGSP
jgi:dolichol-phosphate mannosyltransferase